MPARAGTGQTGQTGEMGQTGQTGEMGQTGQTGEMGQTGQTGEMGQTGQTAECPTGLPQIAGPSGIPMVMRSPRGRWRWPMSRPRGLTGRVGAGLTGPGLPRDEARFSSR
jgi:Collagen triple helix repeat (20 copies)